MATPLDRRNFLRATAAVGASLGLSASSYSAVLGSNSLVRVGFIGCGGRAQAHLNLIVRLALENKGVAPVAVCDVWDGLEETYDHSFGGKTTTRSYSQGLFPAAKKCGLMPGDGKRVVKDYRRLLDLKDVDAVCISTPDHWHARQTLDAFASGKDVYVERPMTRTLAEATAVAEAAERLNRVLTVGFQSLADPSINAARDLIKDGKIGTVTHAASGAFRNDIRGQWRFYRTVPQMTPKTVNWDLFLGQHFEVNGERLAEPRPFDPVAFAQWRCDKAFSSGPLSDLLAAPAARILQATGWRHPRKVVALGDVYLERDGRTVPDVASLIADYGTGQFTFTGATTSAYPVEEIIRGRTGTIKFVKGGFDLFRDDPAGGSRLPIRHEEPIQPSERARFEQPKNETESLWLNFLDCIRARNRATIAGPEIGAAVGEVG